MSGIPDHPVQVVPLDCWRSEPPNLDEASSKARPSGFDAREAPFLGGISTTGSMIQYVNVEHLLPSESRERLFVEE